MAKSSPYPWQVGPEYSNAQDEITDLDGRTIATVWVRRAPPGATARQQFQDVPKLKANIAVMTAAPELLDSLVEVLAFTEDLLARRGDPEALNVPVLQGARNAINKARPEEQAKPAVVDPTVPDPSLAKEVYEQLYRSADSFRDIGVHTSYLLGGLLTGTKVKYQGKLARNAESFVALLKDCFADSHPIWNWVDLSGVVDSAVHPDSVPVDPLADGI